MNCLMNTLIDISSLNIGVFNLGVIGLNSSLQLEHGLPWSPKGVMAAQGMEAWSRPYGKRLFQSCARSTLMALTIHNHLHHATLAPCH